MTRLLQRPSLLLLAAVLLTFFPLILHGQFFWDDFDLILHNPLIASPTTTGLSDIWLSSKNFDYFPLTSTTFWLEWRLWHDWPQPYHLANALLHALSAILLWKIFLRLKLPHPFLIALLFAIHPVNVESVAWIAERKNTLSMACMCASLLAYLHFETTRRPLLYAAALTLFLAALLAKTAVVMLPVILLILAWHQRKTICRADLLATLPFFALSLFLGLITIFFQYHRSISDILVRNDSLPSRLATAACAFWWYLAKALLPLHLMFNYPRWNIMAWGPVAFLPAAALVVMFAVLFLNRRKNVAADFLAALSIYLLLLLPMLGLLNIFYMRYSLVSDHYQYHALPAVLALVVGVGGYAFKKWKTIGYVLVIGIVVLLAADSFTIAETYETPESIWADTLSKNPSSWLAHAQLAQMDVDRIQLDPSRLPRAIQHLQAVIALQPDLATGYANLGAAYLLANQPQLSADAYHAGLRAPIASNNDRARLYQGLGNLAARSSHFDDAEANFAQAVKFDPDSFSIHFALGAAYLAENKLDQARTELQAALAIDPENAGVKRYLAEADARLKQAPPSTATAPHS